MRAKEKPSTGQGQGRTTVKQTQTSTLQAPCPISVLSKPHNLIFDPGTGRWHCPACDLSGGGEALSRLIRLEADHLELDQIKGWFKPDHPLNVSFLPPASRTEFPQFKEAA